MSDLFRLDGKSALVTGGNGGIGLGIAKGLSEAGAGLVIAARDKAKSARAVEQITDAGGRAIAVECDVRDRDAVKGAVDVAVDTFGGLDILVANAGIGRAASPQDVTAADWDDVIDTNLSAVFWCCQASYPHLRDSDGGSVITIASEYSIFGSPQFVSYTASKGGVVQLTKSLAVAWAQDGIRVNSILPGWIWTELTAPLATEENADRRASIIARTPFGKIAEPEELAGTAVYLASAASAFVTGQTVAVDGGYSIM